MRSWCIGKEKLGGHHGGTTGGKATTNKKDRRHKGRGAIKRDEKAVKEDEKKPNRANDQQGQPGREWGTGEISRVTAPREGTTEVEKTRKN